MLVGGIDAEADDLDVALVELGLQPRHVAELGRADGREILGVGEQYGPGIAEPVVELDVALRGVGFEIGSGVANAHRESSRRIQQIPAVYLHHFFYRKTRLRESAPLSAFLCGAVRMGFKDESFLTKRGGLSCRHPCTPASAKSPNASSSAAATRAAAISTASTEAAQFGPDAQKTRLRQFRPWLRRLRPDDKEALRDGDAPNLAIVTAYNDMLSAHQPFERFPELIKRAARAAGGTAQVAGGVPAMCDGVTQGEAGMELSLFSRDVIALSTAVALSHQMFDAAVYLGVCDKIVPGLLIGALSFGHLPAVFLPAGPMTSGLSNDDKSKIRQLYAEGKATRAELLESEAKAYHGPGTCTFYGTANTNQMLMEIMGLHLPGASFVNPNTPLRDALTEAGAKRALELTAAGNAFTPIGHVIDERAVVNGVVGLHATGGSTNHDDPSDRDGGGGRHRAQLGRFRRSRRSDAAAGAHLSQRQGRREPFPGGGRHAGADPLAARRRACCTATRARSGARASAITSSSPRSRRGRARLARGGRRRATTKPCCARRDKPFQATGGLRVLEGPLGRAVIKTSAVAPERHVIEAPARVFHSQEELQAAFRAGELDRDFVAVVRFQGPSANGMPELHKLMPPLGVLQDRGHKVALVTDGRLSGASGKVPAAIHVTPEAANGGAIAKIRDGDIIRLDAPERPARSAGRRRGMGNRPHRHARISAATISASAAICSAPSAPMSGRADAGASIFAA